jgi:outer membrane lipoprotein-sorting protein
MKNLRLFPLALVLAFVATSARAQDDKGDKGGKEGKSGGDKAGGDKAAADLPKAEKVLDDFVAATGGKEAYEKHKSAHMTGTLKIPAQGLKGKIEIHAKAPSSMVFTMNIAGIGDIRQGYDGKVAWELNPMQGGVRELDGAEKDQRVRDSAFNAEIKWRDLYTEVKTTGTETIEGKDCFVVEMTPKTGAPRKEWFDKETKLLVCSEDTQEGPSGKITARSYSSDWKEVDGVKIAMAVKVVVGPMTQELKLKDVKFNVEIEDKVFAKPAEPEGDEGDGMSPKKEGADKKKKDDDDDK